MKKRLLLTIKRKWFDKILSGEKTIEYRQVKKYYNSKLKKQYEEIILQAGYSKNSPRLKADVIKIQIEKVTIKLPLFDFEENYYCIYLKNPKLMER